MTVGILDKASKVNPTHLFIILAYISLSYHFIHMSSWLGKGINDFICILQEPTILIPKKVPIIDIFIFLIMLFIFAAPVYFLLRKLLKVDLPQPLLISLSIGITLCSLGTITILLMIVSILYRAILLSLFLISLIITIYLIFIYKHKILKAIKNMRPKLDKVDALSLVYLLFIILFSYYHAILFPVTEFDSLIYHAAMARIIYDYHPIQPIFSGTSVGIEISANYPPLYPSIAAFFYILLDSLNDFFIKVLSPTFFVLTLVSIYYTCIEISNGSKYSGWIGTILYTTSPLIIIYSRLETNYIFTAYLLITSFLLYIQFLKYKNNGTLYISILFCAFAMLAHYLCILYFIIFIFLLITTRVNLFTGNLRALLISMIIFSLGFIWYLRNFIILGDPFYPWGYKIFKSDNIDPTMLEYTIMEIVHNTGIPQSNNITEKFWIVTKSLLFNQYVFSPLVYLYLLSISTLNRHNKNILLCFLVPVIFYIYFTIKGWFWYRYLILILPFVCVCSGLSIDDILRNKNKTLKIIILLVIVISLFIPMILSVIGVKAPSIRSNLIYYNTLNIKYILENQGDDDAILSSLYGDYKCWKWINEHVNGNIATFDVAIYYINNYKKYFYLDGIEARNLYNMSSICEILSFMKKNNITHIFIPAWARSGLSMHPGFSKLIIKDYLNTEIFPESFRVGGSAIYSVNYSYYYINCNKSNIQLD